MNYVEQKGIDAIRQAARDANKNDAKLLRKIIEEEMRKNEEDIRKKAEVLRESLGASNECVRKCGHDWSEE